MGNKSSHWCPHKKGEDIQQHKEDRVKTEAEIRVIRNTRSHEKLGKAMQDFLQSLWRGHDPANTLISVFRPPECERIHFSCKPPNL